MKQARHAPEPEPEPVAARWQPRQVGGKGKGASKGKSPGSSNAILVRSLDIGKIIGKGGQTIKVCTHIVPIVHKLSVQT